jgi:hypothetical protein
MDVDRNNYEFEKAVGEHFAYLQDFGFAVSNSSPTIVSFTRGDVSVTIFHGRSSYEVGAEVGFEATSYSVGELIRLSDKVAGAEFRNPAATTTEVVAASVAMTADLMKRYGQEAIAGDRATFDELAQLRNAWGQQYELEVRAYQVRPKAEVAFRSGDYGAAALLYQSIRPLLTPVEVAKLELAERKSKI